MNPYENIIEDFNKEVQEFHKSVSIALADLKKATDNMNKITEKIKSITIPTQEQIDELVENSINEELENNG